MNPQVRNLCSVRGIRCHSVNKIRWWVQYEIALGFCVLSQKRSICIRIAILENWLKIVHSTYYASPSSCEAYRDRRLTTNFELWVEIFCVPICFHVRIPKPCLSVWPHLEKINHSFVNISPTLVIDTSMERSSRVLHHGNPKIWFFF